MVCHSSAEQGRETYELSDAESSRLTERIAALSIWSGRVDPKPLAGGITNQNFKVEDGGRRYVVRVGHDSWFMASCAQPSLPQAAPRISRA